MRTRIEIDQRLLAEAMAATGHTTKRATVATALRGVIRLRDQKRAGMDMAGLGWEGAGRPDWHWGGLLCIISIILHIERRMRTNIEIDDRLLAEAMAATGQTTKRATVEAALRFVIHLRDQAAAIERLKGIGWDGDLDAMREGRAPD